MGDNETEGKEAEPVAFSLHGPQEIDVGMFKHLQFVTKKILTDFTNGREFSRCGNGTNDAGVYWHKNRKWVPPKEYKDMIAVVKSAVQQAADDGHLFGFLNDNANLEVVSVSLENAALLVDFHKQALWKGPAGHLVAVLVADSWYTVMGRNTKNHKDQCTIVLKQGQAYAQTAAKIEEWESKCVVDEREGKGSVVLILSVGFAEKAVKVKKEPVPPRPGNDDDDVKVQHAPHICKAVFIKLKY